MASKDEVIQSFLVSLGFKVDTPSAKSFASLLVATEKQALVVGEALAGVAIAAEAMVQEFAHGMEKLYYASKRTGASVENIQALQYAFGQIGLSADEASQTIKNFSRSLRTNPGLSALLNSFGVKTEGRDRVAVMLDFVKQLKTMPFYVASQFAQMFGIDPDTLLMMEQGGDKLNELMAVRLRLYKLAGINAQEAAEASKDYANSLRDLWTRVEVLGQALSIKLLPYFHQLVGVINEFLDDVASGDFSNFAELAITLEDINDQLVAIAKNVKGFTESDGFITVFDTVLNKIKDMVKALGQVGTIWADLFGGDLLSKDGTKRLWEDIKAANKTLWQNNDPVAKMGMVPGKGQDQPYGGGVMGKIKETVANAGGAAVLFKGLESAYGLPPGLLDSVWKQESNRGHKMLSKRGAKGHFQFMDDTAKQYGVTDPNDLTNSATGAAKYLAHLEKLFGGDTFKALSAYNWGEGNVLKYGLGAAPAETRAYAPSVMKRAGITINQETKITVAGTKDPEAAAAAVVVAQRQTNADLARNAASIPQ